MAACTVNSWTTLASSATAGTHTATNAAVANRIYVRITRAGTVVDQAKLPFSGSKQFTTTAGDLVEAMPVNTSSGTATVTWT